MIAIPAVFYDALEAEANRVGGIGAYMDFMDPLGQPAYPLGLPKTPDSTPCCIHGLAASLGQFRFDPYGFKIARCDNDSVVVAYNEARNITPVFSRIPFAEYVKALNIVRGS